jgi:methanogenic corrinoid protein MtbC1
MAPRDEHPMSIGALAKATGVPADTLRTWERRYGFPAPERTDSGHRRYSLQTLERLRMVLQAIKAGHRASTALAADEATLLRWLAADGGKSITPHAQGAGQTDETVAQTVERWLGHVMRYEGRALMRELRVSFNAMGGIAFLDRLLAPFLETVGERWAQGVLGVAQEHLASERVEEFLAQSWRPLSDAATGAVRVCAAPPGEQHVLGLHMAALVLALHDTRVVFLGANVPIEELVHAAEHNAAEAVLLSAATGLDPLQLTRDLELLRVRLPSSTQVVAGGGGVSEVPAGVIRVENLAALAAWVRSAA